MKLAVIIPAYNEERSILNVLDSIPKKFPGVSRILSIVIDDGSSDKTYENARTRTKYVARHLVNLGLGAALITGFEIAKKFDCDLVVTLDGDGQHNSDDIKNLLKPILNNQTDVVIGTRMLSTGGMPFIRIIGNWLMNALTVLVFHKWSSDTQSGMRAFNRRALDRMKLYSTGYEISSEIIGEIHHAKLKMVEVPIQTIYTDYSKAKGQSWFNGINILTKIITIRVSRKKK